MSGIVTFLGAGATKSCKGPLTSEILPNIMRAGGPPDPSHREGLLRDFLSDQFHVTDASPNDQYPGLSLIMSLIDTALDRRQGFHRRWSLDRMADLREAIEFTIYDHLEDVLRSAPTNNHYSLFAQLYPGPERPSVITTNYDLIADAAIMNLGQNRFADDGRFPDYRCQISDDFYNRGGECFGTLLKLHGSLNWLCCRTCGRLQLGASASTKYLRVVARMLGPSLEKSYSPDGAPCGTCQTKLRPLLIAPTHLKNYRNAHIGQVWYAAEQELRAAERVIFIGYSLPDDDVEVVYLLKRSLAHLEPSQISVIEYSADGQDVVLAEHPVGRRYRTLFGDGLQWNARGLDAWLRDGTPLR